MCFWHHLYFQRWCLPKQFIADWKKNRFFCLSSHYFFNSHLEYHWSSKCLITQHDILVSMQCSSCQIYAMQSHECKKYFTYLPYLIIWWVKQETYNLFILASIKRIAPFWVLAFHHRNPCVNFATCPEYKLLNYSQYIIHFTLRLTLSISSLQIFSRSWEKWLSLYTIIYWHYRWFLITISYLYTIGCTTSCFLILY